MTPAELARKMETDAVAFYKEAADKCSSPSGKRIFLSIMEDEKRHIAMIDAIIKGMGAAAEKMDPMANVKSVFEAMRAEMSEKFKATDSEKKALTIAMGMEKEGYEYYKKCAAEARDEATRALFQRLYEEEVKHHQIFSNTLNFLDDTGNWFMWEERGVIEG